MERKIIKTADGSATIFLPEWNEHYHSKHGALQEAYHVFINTGLQEWLTSKKVEQVSILEIGFGTGLNAFITLLEGEKMGIKVKYTGVEAYPVTAEELEKLNYTETFKEAGAKEFFDLLHKAPWEESKEISSFFELHKMQRFFHEINEENVFDIVYFDAFGPRVQPELWSEEIFTKMYKALKPEGILVTYSAKGSVRRAMQAVGFSVERLPGPPGKREMLRATRL